MKKIIGFLLFGLVATGAIYNRSLVLMDATGQTTSTNGAVTTFDSTAMPNRASGIACRLTTVKNSGTNPTIDAKVQTCSTASASDCEDLCVFTQRTTETSGGQSIFIAGDYGAYNHFHAVTTLGGTSPNYDVKIEVLYY